MKKFSISLSLLLVLINLSACGGGSSNSNTTELDESLVKVINDVLPENGHKGLILPEMDEFEAIPQDPNNLLTVQKVKLGQFLYHETGLARAPKNSNNGNAYSCASCHHAKAGFQAGRRQGIGEGGMGFGSNGESRQRDEFSEDSAVDVQPIRSPSVLNSAYQEVMLWNGQFGATGLNEGTEDQWTQDTPKENNFLGFHGLETQAIAGITVHRLKSDKDFAVENNYQDLFDDAFPDVTEDERYNIVQAGRAIAAYERTLMATQSPFQLWLKGDNEAMTQNQKRGAIIFFSKGNCASCHNNPALSSRSFHAIGMGELSGDDILKPDTTTATSRGRGGFTKNPADDYKFKTPQLYNLKDSPFLGHGATFNSVREIVEYKNMGIPQSNDVPEQQLATEFTPLGLTEEEILQLTDFIENGLYDPFLERFVPDSLPSNLCFPNNDPQSREELGCQEVAD